MRNKELFYKVAEMVTDEHHYNQGVWADFADGAWPDNIREISQGEIVEIDPCGTAACIAGNAMIAKQMVGLTMNKWMDELEFVLNQDHSLYDKGTAIRFCAPTIAADLLDLELEEAAILFDEDWEPKEGLTVPDALRMLGDGADIEDVTLEDCLPYRY